MALEPIHDTTSSANGYSNTDAHSDTESSKIDDDDDDDDDNDELIAAHVHGKFQRLAVACDDGCVRLYNATELDELTYIRSFPRVSG